MDLPPQYENASSRFRGSDSSKYSPVNCSVEQPSHLGRFQKKLFGFPLRRERSIRAQSRRYEDVSESDSSLTSGAEQNWKPTSLTTPFLASVILITIVLILTLQLLLWRSHQNGGLFFASDVNAAPIRQTFVFLYLPTIISVVYGVLWTWIDVDVRRLEPFYQLSRKAPATGIGSLLLHYPVDFLASVPIKAIKFRHWSVFVASMGAVFTFWGLTPTQSGIFAVEVVNRTFDISFARSTQYIPIAQQGDILSSQSATSVASIIWLNETLQPYMAREYVLAPFTPLTKVHEAGSQETWTGVTQRYSVNITCEEPILWTDSSNSTFLNSTWGCSYSEPNPGVSPNSNNDKVFQTLYVGYPNPDGNADYYLSDGSCPTSQNQTFLIQWTKALIPISQFSKLLPSQIPLFANITRRWCRSSYFQQDVRATVFATNKQIVNYTTLSDARPLPPDIFNITEFEGAMSTGKGNFTQRSNFPTQNWPSQDSFLSQLPLNLDYLPKMAPFALGALQRPLDDYLNGTVLEDSYEAAYRLLFARQMINVLSKDVDAQSLTRGQRRYSTQAIVMVPAFTYVAEGFLSVVAVLTMSLLYTSRKRQSKLKSDPGTLAATMALCANDKQLLQAFRGCDRHSAKDLEERFSCCTFHMSETGRVCLTDEPRRPHKEDTRTAADTENVVRGVQPLEFKLKTGAVFFSMQLFLFAFILALLWMVRRHNGLPLPSQNQFVRQLVENYLPIIIGTIIEPFWLVLNRHLCSLQPFETLRTGHKKASQSIEIRYSSFPPQFVIWKALRRGHYLLGAVCAMTLLANLLSIAFSGLFFEDFVPVETAVTFQQPHSLHFVPLNGSSGPFVATKGATMEPFYIATSNMTAGTPMPPWADDKYFYLPFLPEKSDSNGSWTYRATTSALGVRANCQSQLAKNLTLKGPDSMDGSQLSSADLTVTVTDDKGAYLQCTPRFSNQNEPKIDLIGGLSVRGAVEINTALDGRGLPDEQAAFCREHVAALWIRATSDSLKSDSPGTLQYPPFNISSFNASMIVCHPEFVHGIADVIVDSKGFVLDRLSFNASADSVEQLFASSSSDLLGQVHQFVIDAGSVWHEDDNPSDFMNYLMAVASNDSLPYRTSADVPDPAVMVPRFEQLYSKLFTLVVGRNIDQLLTNTSRSNTLDGYTRIIQTRIFMSLPFSVIAETILGLFIAATIGLYTLRPWRILARMPDTPASVIAYVAASNAVRDFEGTVPMTSKERAALLRARDGRYGFGTFVGTDGKTHIGVEKHPFLAPLKREGTGLSWQSASQSSDSDAGAKRWGGLRWRSRDIKEGGWI